jgi:hypothetical protein
MFKINGNPSFLADVRITVLGAAEVGVVPMTFRALSTKELAALEASMLPTESGPGRSDAEVLEQIILGWSGVIDDAGEPVTWSRQALEELLDHHPMAAPEIWAQYKAARLESRAKN